MDDLLARRLVKMNAEFYDAFAGPFAASRQAPQPGFTQLLDYLPDISLAVLDIGCGNGRFGRFLNDYGKLNAYTGVDMSPAMLATIDDLSGKFLVRDISLPGCLHGLDTYDLIACLATLQHIPGQTNRQRLLQEMASHLRSPGLIILSNWQFLENPRQRRKIRPWSSMGIDSTQLEPKDYLISWERGGTGVRYVSFLDAETITRMANDAGLRVVNHYLSDGREGDLNLYSILAS